MNALWWVLNRSESFWVTPVDVMYRFSGFRVDPVRRLLFGPDDKPISLKPRVFDTLLYLIEHRGDLLEKQVMLDAIWPHVVVEENNLNQAISTLRRVLGETRDEHRFIVTEPGRGYRFVARVEAMPLEPLAAMTPAEPSIRRNDDRSSSVHGIHRALMGRRLPYSLAVVLALALGLAVSLQYGSRPAVAPNSDLVTDRPTKSIAVLPFADLSESEAHRWVADGLTEEILNSLSQLPELKVTAGSSSFQFKDENRDVRQIAAQLGVANVIEGSTRVSGDQLRVTAKLIRATDGFQLWSQDYDGTTNDLFKLEREVAERVAVALDIVLDDARRARMSASGTQNVEAFREYQEGWRIYNVVHSLKPGQTLWDANVHFERAVALDPDYAQAALGSTDAFAHFLTTPRLSWVSNSPFTPDEAMALLQQKLDFVVTKTPNATRRLAADLYREMYSPTWYRMSSLVAQLHEQWDVDSLAFGGGVDGALWLADLLLINHQDDLARSLARKHVTEDPLSPDGWVLRMLVEIQSGQYESARTVVSEARRQLGSAFVENLEFAVARAAGDYPKALESLEQLPPNPNLSMYIAAIKGSDSAMQMVREGEKRLGSGPLGAGASWLLLAYYELGETERASALVKRIDALPAGAAIFASFIYDNGNCLFFDLDAAPNFVAKLKQAHINPKSFKPLTRLSALR